MHKSFLTITDRIVKTEQGCHKTCERNARIHFNFYNDYGTYNDLKGFN